MTDLQVLSRKIKHDMKSTCCTLKSRYVDDASGLQEQGDARGLQLLQTSIPESTMSYHDHATLICACTLHEAAQ